jgi:hypothetical protein
MEEGYVFNVSNNCDPEVLESMRKDVVRKIKKAIGCNSCNCSLMPICHFVDDNVRAGDAKVNGKSVSVEIKGDPEQIKSACFKFGRIADS